MHILLINDFLHGGGAEVVFHQMKLALVRLGHKVDIFYWKENKCVATNPLAYIYNFGAATMLEGVLRINCYSLIVVFNYASALSPSVIGVLRRYKRKQRCKVVYNSHDAHIICPNSGLNYFTRSESRRFENAYSACSGFIFKRLDHRGWAYSSLKKVQWLLAYRIMGLYRVFDTVISPSHFLLERIQRFYPDMNGCVIRNPCIESVEEHVSKMPPGDLLKLIFIGRLSHEKGLLPLINAITGVDSPYLLDIYGIGPQEKDIEKAIRQNGLSEKINLKGGLPHKQIMELLDNYDAMILPSIVSETAPASIIEAASKKLFVITMGYGGMKEMAEKVGNYVFVNPLSTKSLEEAFEILRRKEFKDTDLTEFTFGAYMDALKRELTE